MAITSAICTSFKQEILVEGHNLTNGADSIKLALYTSSATLGAGTTALPRQVKHLAQTTVLVVQR